MWVRRAAIRPVPSYARLTRGALESIEEQLSKEGEHARLQLEQAFQRFEETQPVLAARLGEALSAPLDETALALGYFLTLSIWLAFESAFGSELEGITETQLEGVEQALALDEQIRSTDPAEALESDDVVGMEQPDVLEFVREHLEAAIQDRSGQVDVDDVHGIYRVVLVEVLALSYAVKPPPHVPVATGEISA